MKQAPFIEYGATLSMVAPSFGVTTEPYFTRYNQSIKNLKRLGFEIKEGDNVHLDVGTVSSNTPELRAKEFMDAYQDKNTQAIFSVGGGELMCDILPYINFNKLKKLPPKWFIGYSDNTNLVFPLAVLADTISIYGPCGTTFYEKPFRLSEKNTLKMLMGEKSFKGYKYYSKEVNDHSNPLNRIKLDQKKVIQAFNYENPFEGVLLGGCLDCLLTLCGTKYDKVKAFQKNHKEGIIWFLEACDLNVLSYRRGLFQLKEAGWFDNAKGFIIGRPLCIEQEIMGVNHISAVTDILSSFNVPILMDVDLGHLPPVLPIKCGANCKVSFHDNNIFMDYKE